MKAKCCTAQIVAVVPAVFLVPVLVLGLSACGSAQLFVGQTLEESPDVADAPYPRLVDTPEAPAIGTYTAAAPDPAQGAAVQLELSAQAVAATGRAEALEAELFDPDEDAAQGIDTEATQARREELAKPIISDAEREELRRRAARKQPTG